MSKMYIATSIKWTTGMNLINKLVNIHKLKMLIMPAGLSHARITLAAVTVQKINKNVDQRLVCTFV